ncbi:MAG: serine/threonine protein kinase [Bradymonadia bacterium]
MRRARSLGPYRLLYRISSGGMAEIYRAARRDADGELEAVAIKRLLSFYTADQEFIDMLIDEAKITCLFDHPNITRTYEFSHLEDEYFLVMEYVEGVDLRSALRRCRAREMPWPVEYGLWAVEQALRGLHCAHEQVDLTGEPLDIVHRDFSPSNIMVSYRGEVKLIDFGIAKGRLNRVKTRVGVIKGKVRYMSPEQTMGRRLDRRSDVFAAGAVLFETLTGETPFKGSEDVEVMEAIRHQPHPGVADLPGLDATLERILARALAKDAEARYATAEAFADELEVYRRDRFPRFKPLDLGRTLSRIFARERMEHDERYQEFDLVGPSDDDTPTGLRVNYTRLVDMTGPLPGLETLASLERAAHTNETHVHDEDTGVHESNEATGRFLDPDAATGHN